VHGYSIANSKDKLQDPLAVEKKTRTLFDFNHYHTRHVKSKPAACGMERTEGSRQLAVGSKNKSVFAAHCPLPTAYCFLPSVLS
jgi:hypothetical protein